jgi:hypothetical protein
MGTGFVMTVWKPYKKIMDKRGMPHAPPVTIILHNHADYHLHYLQMLTSFVSQAWVMWQPHPVTLVLEVWQQLLWQSEAAGAGC